MSTFYKRITLVVADIERSLKIYRDILGFTLNSLELTEVKGCDLPERNGIHMTASVIKVADLKVAISQIETLGLETTEPTTDSNDNFSFSEQAFVDFDGHLVVLYEIIEK